MMKLKTKTMVCMAMLALMATVAWQTAIADSNTDSAPTKVVPRKRHHRRKKTTSAPAAGTTTAAPAAKDTHPPTLPNSTDAPGMSNSLGSNDPGGPNMGSPDHVPGTTGTSGQ